MKFKIGEFLYRVRISHNKLYTSNEQEVAGIFSWSERTIWISGIIEAAARAETLMNELNRAWESHFGELFDKTSKYASNAHFALAMSRQFYNQGGPAQLMRLTAEGVADHTLSILGHASNFVGAQCSACGTMFSAAQVNQSETFVDSSTGVIAIWRWVDCDFCGDLQVWPEQANDAGRAIGNPLAAPQHLRHIGRIEFLKKHVKDGRIAG